MNSWNVINTLIISIFGSGGLIIWFLHKSSKKRESKDLTNEDIKTIKEKLSFVQEGLVMTLENDKVIFKALRNHEINGESENQEEKMDEYFLSLFKHNGEN